MKLIESPNHYDLVSDIEDMATKWNRLGIRLLIKEHKHYIDLNLIVVPKEVRNEGVGTQVLKDINKHSSGKLVIANPSLGYGATSLKRLRTFYERQNIYVETI